MIKLTDNLEINKPAPADDRLGVFASVAEANSYIHEDRRFLGLKVLIDNAGTAEEYWYQSGITDEDLVIYSSGDGGGGVPYSGATQDVNLGIHDLYTNKVFLYDEPNDNYASIHYSDGDFHIEDADGHKLLVIEDGFIQLHKTDTIQSNLFTTDLTETRDHYLPDQDGTLAVTSDITKEAVGLGNVDNTSDADKPVSTATQTALNAKENSITAGTTSQYFRGDKTFQNLPIQALANAGSVSITITATGSANLQTLTGHAFTIPESQMPVGATIQINGMCERIATGSGIGSISYDINGTKRYITSPSGHQYQYQINLYRESSTSIRMMGGSSGSVMQGAYGSVNASSTTATITAGGNIVFQLSGFGSVINDQIAYRFFKATLIL